MEDEASNSNNEVQELIKENSSEDENENESL